jgi:hypothetical protein
VTCHSFFRSNAMSLCCCCMLISQFKSQNMRLDASLACLRHVVSSRHCDLGAICLEFNLHSPWIFSFKSNCLSSLHFWSFVSSLPLLLHFCHLMPPSYSNTAPAQSFRLKPKRVKPRLVTNLFGNLFGVKCQKKFVILLGGLHMESSCY